MSLSWSIDVALLTFGSPRRVTIRWPYDVTVPGYLDHAAIALLCGLLADGCATGPTGPVAGSPATAIITTSPLIPPVELARQDLAARTGTSVDQIVVVSAQPTTWPDTCLGLPAPEMCVPGATPGYVVELMVRGKVHIYHTDREAAWRYAGPK